MNYEKACDQFEIGKIDASSFGHADHIGIAYVMLCRYEFFDALLRYANGIRELAAKAGAEHKFNATITLAFFSIIAERMQAKDYTTAEEFLGKNTDIQNGSVLDKWYTTDVLNSDIARKIALLPITVEKTR